MSSKIKKIGIMTSGGDSPGMNATIRSVVRKAIHEGLEVVGILRGYEGLIDGELMDLHSRSVSNILGRGGTILKTARSKRFMTKEGQEKAVKVIKDNGIDALVIIGGNGSLQGALVLEKEWDITTVGLPGTIDNDLGHTDQTIGCHTSVHTVLDAVDKIRDTVTSMERIYVIEVMGREEPFIAVMAGLAGGAEEVLFPGAEVDFDKMMAEIKDAKSKGKQSWIIIISEGCGNAETLAARLDEAGDFDVRPVVLGHVQRGGIPLAPDRVIASAMGAEAIDFLLEGKRGVMVGIEGRKLKSVPYEKACFDREKDMAFYDYLYGLTKLFAK